jgi:hypothetical protein
VAVDFTTVNVTALAGADYTDTNDTLVFLPGETTNVLTLMIDDDLLYESTETFRFVLGGITNSSLGITTNTVSITDDDLAVVEFTMSAATPSEIDGGLTVTVERTGATNTTVSVAFTTTDGTALAGSDYTATNGVITFDPGETSHDIYVALEFDAEADPAETFRLRLTSFTNAAPGDNTNLVVTIGDGFGDPPPELVVAISSIGRANPELLMLHVTGPSGTPVVIESTTNFLNWIPLSTNIISGGAFDWPAPIDRSTPARFYRVAPPKP